MSDLLNLNPIEVVDEAPQAIVDAGIPGEWQAIVDPRRLIAPMWRRLRQIRDALTNLTGIVARHTTTIAAQHDEIVAIETTLGVNPQGSRATVADRLTAIEARLTLLEGRTP